MPSECPRTRARCCAPPHAGALPVPWIQASDVAEAVLYLAGPGARYVTGTTLVVDAGLLTR